MNCDPVMFLNEDVWSTDNGVCFSGNIFYRNQLLDQYEVVNHFSTITSLQSFIRVLKNMNGFFSVIVENETDIYIGSSHIQTIPLFYYEGDKICITDKYRWLENKISADTYSAELATEFVYSSQIFTNETLCSDIKQLQGGEAVQFSKTDSCIAASERYYSPPSSSVMNEHQLKEKLDKCLDEVFSRVKELAEDQELILLLSGGYDSRLVALKIYEQNIQNVSAVTGNWSSSYDIPVAKDISQNLGFNFVEIEQSREDIIETYNSKSYKKIEEAVSGHGTIFPTPTYQHSKNMIDRSSKLPGDGLIISGMTPADGMEIPVKSINSNSMEYEELLNFIMDKYYSFGPISADVEKVLRKRISNRLPDSSEFTSIEVQKILMRWYLDGINSNSPDKYTYKLYGYDVWEPFHDQEFLEFFSSLPLEYQYDRRILESYTEEKNNELLNGLQIGPNRSLLENIIIDSSLSGVCKKIKNGLSSGGSAATAKEAYENNYRLAHLPFEHFRDDFTGNEKRQYFLAKHSLRQIDLKPEGDLPFRM